jgi:prepilin-type N-terminal cleavage/methylation domain-containing protein
MRRERGFTLVEGLMALVLIGVVLAAVFYFVGSSQRASGSVARNASESEVRLSADRLETLIANVGYMGDVFPGAWQPVIDSGENSFTFVANLTETDSFGPEDTVTVTSSGGFITIADASGSDFMQPIPGGISFSYFDAAGAEVTDPAMVRRIEYTLTSLQGTEFTGSVSPRNLAAAHDPAMLRELFVSGDDGGFRFEHVIFLEDFETPTPFAFEDHMEAGWYFLPIISEYFEDPVTWNNNWQLYIEDDGYGRIRRWTNSEAYEGQSCLALDCWRTGTSTQMAVWKIDLSGYNEWTDELLLDFWWREFNDPLHPEDGVYLTQFVPGSSTAIFSENFSGFSDGWPRSWTFWADDYGRVEVMTAYSPPSGAYLNLDTRRQGYTGTSRVMLTQDLSAFAGSTDLELAFSICKRGSQNEYFRVMIMGSDGITGTPLATHNINLAAYPSGSWSDVVIDLDELIPAGYDLSNTRIVFAQRGPGFTAGASWNGGVSIDNVAISETTAEYWDMSMKIADAPNSFNGWENVTLDLSYFAQIHGMPFSSEYYIGFAQKGTEPIDVNGIAVDQVSVLALQWGMEGWTHGPWPGYTLSEWQPSDHSAYSGNWCYATAGSGSYQATPTRAWLQSPLIDLTGYPAGERMAIAFFHRYTFGTSGDGCNVKITQNNGETWDLIVPYWGYYTAMIPALGNEPGWSGTTGSLWNFSVIDITEYAGEEVRLRFNYGTTGSSSNTGWDVDYTRSRAGADWPQIVWGYTPEKADWFAYAWVGSGTHDPTSTPDGSRWAGNDMGTWGIWNLQYENSQHNALITPPIVYTMDNYDTFAYMEFYASPRFEPGYDYGYVQAARFSEIAPHPFDDWHTFCTVNSVQPDWGHYRFRVDQLPSTVFGPNRTVVFRWRMTSDGSIVYGGWNIDRLRFFSTDVWLPDVVHGPINGVYPREALQIESRKGEGMIPTLPPFYRETPAVVPVGNPFDQEVTR